MKVNLNCNHTSLGHLLYHDSCPHHVSSSIGLQQLAMRMYTFVGNPIGVVGLIALVVCVAYKIFLTLSNSAGNKLGQEALDFAREELAKYPDIEANKYDKSTYSQYGDNDIDRLTSLFWDVYFKNFEAALQENPDQPWKREAVLTAADSLMKVGYAVSRLTLEDLPGFTARLERGEGVKRTYVEALTQQDAYQYRTYYLCPRAYHWIRGGAVWRKATYSFQKDGVKHIPPEESGALLKEHAKPFYQKNTRQHSWAQLYRDYCDRVGKWVKIDELGKLDSRHVKWIHKDLEGQEFPPTPTSLPT